MGCFPALGRDFGTVGKSETAKVARGLRSLAAGREECPLVGLQQVNPGGDIARIANVAVKAEFGTEERSA
jgi:hypothetical protein